MSSDPAPFRIADTTLRDGEQTPGVRFTADQKQEIATALAMMGIPALDVGFPAVSREERESIRRIVRLNLPSRIMTLCRPLKTDIDWAMEAEVKTLILFIGVSDVHIQAKFGGSRQKVLDIVESGVSYAVNNGFTVTFAGEDATRADMGLLLQVIGAAVREGARSVSIPDTVGVATPDSMALLTRVIRRAFPEVGVSMHCHDDFGLACANTISGALAGASTLSVTVNGIGERAGNASLEEVVMTLKELYGYDLGIDTTQLRPISEMVARYSGVPVAPNKPVVGDHAFTHESGIHIHGLLHDARTYEPYPAERIGNVRRYVLGKHSGRASVATLAASVGISLTDAQIDSAVEFIKQSANTRGWSTDELRRFFAQMNEDWVS